MVTMIWDDSYEKEYISDDEAGGGHDRVDRVTTARKYAVAISYMPCLRRTTNDVATTVCLRIYT